MKELSYDLSEIAALTYGWVPRLFRKALLPAFIPAFALARRLPAIISQVRLPVIRLEGRERSHGRQLALLACGRREALPFISDLIFADVHSREDLGRVFLGNLSDLAASLRTRTDLVLFHADVALARPLGARGFFLLPEWVDMSLDLSRPLRETWTRPGNKNLRENLRRIRKYGYSFEVTTERAKFDDFYRRMYLPFIPERFGAATRVVGPRKMRRFFESGVLLLVKRDDEPVAGNIILLASGAAVSLIAGLRQGDPVLLRQSALAASYYFTLLWAESKKLGRVDFGGCRPLLNDGLVYFKKSWGMSVGRSAAGGNVYGLRVLRPSPAARDFLAANPFIHLDGSGLRGFVLSETEGPLTSADTRALLRTLFIPGLDGLTLLSPAGFAREARQAAASGSWGNVLLRQGPPGRYFETGPGLMALWSGARPPVDP